MTDALQRHPIDDPQILQNLFFVRKTLPRDDGLDGRIPVAEGIELGYRFYPRSSGSPVLLYWHGNGEIASDYDPIVPFYHAAGVSFLVVDYRGYGWSSGYPLASTMLSDASAVLQALPNVLAQYDAADAPLFVKGRSLGSAPAAHLAQQHADQLRGVIIESGYADTPSLFRRLNIPVPEALLRDARLPLNNAAKIAQTRLPLLVIHGAADTLLPAEHGRALYDAHPGDASSKRLLIIDGAGHNDVMTRDIASYFDAVRRFVQAQLA